jgi:hypothetical protein
MSMTFSPDGEKPPKITVEEVRNLIEAGRVAERADLRAKVEALTSEYDAAEQLVYVIRDDVLALLDRGESDG